MKLPWTGQLQLQTMYLRCWMESSGRTVLYLVRLKTANVANILIHCLQSVMVTWKTKLQTTVIKKLNFSISRIVCHLVLVIFRHLSGTCTLNVYQSLSLSIRRMKATADKLRVMKYSQSLSTTVNVGSWYQTPYENNRTMGKLSEAVTSAAQ